MKSINDPPIAIGVKNVDAYTHLGQPEFSHSLSLDWGGDSLFLKLRGYFNGSSDRAARSTQTFDGFVL
jgi:hypothetical protein